MILDYEHFGVETNMQYANWFTFANNIYTIGPNAGPYGMGYILHQSSGGLFRAPIWTPTQHLFVNFHMRPLSLSTSILLQFRNGGTELSRLVFESNGTITFRLGNNTLVTTTSATFPLNAWFFIQVEVVLSTAGAGLIRIWKEGTLIAERLAVTTSSGATDFSDGWGVSSGTCELANLIFYDTTGDEPTTRTPETLCYIGTPTGAGAASDFVPNGAGSNYTYTDEIPADNDTTYVATATVGARDLYTFSAGSPLGATIYAVAVECSARKDDAGANTLSSLVRSGTTEDAQGTHILSTTYQRFRALWHRDPDTTLPWTPPTANAAQAGVKRIV